MDITQKIDNKIGTLALNENELLFMKSGFEKDLNELKEDMKNLLKWTEKIDKIIKKQMPY